MKRSGLVKYCLSLLLALSYFDGAMSGQASAQTADLLKEGQAALDRGDFEHAIQDFERVRQSAPQNLQANRGLLLSYLQAGRLNDAEQLGREAVAHWPDDPQLQHWLGLVYFKSQQNAAALQTLRRAEQLDGNQFEIHFDLALVLLDQNQFCCWGALFKTRIGRCRRLSSFTAPCALIRLSPWGITTWASPTPAWAAIKMRLLNTKKN